MQKADQKKAGPLNQIDRLQRCLPLEAVSNAGGNADIILNVGIPKSRQVVLDLNGTNSQVMAGRPIEAPAKCKGIRILVVRPVFYESAAANQSLSERRELAQMEVIPGSEQIGNHTHVDEGRLARGPAE